VENSSTNRWPVRRRTPRLSHGGVGQRPNSAGEPHICEPGLGSARRGRASVCKPQAAPYAPALGRDSAGGSPFRAVPQTRENDAVGARFHGGRV